ncbi:hypothetical protein HYU18_00760 [Candidatus Woesearchaeota archaeon]|nr:hypothetical protein [Candidatus Woesearchaeota archaeon]
MTTLETELGKNGSSSYLLWKATGKVTVPLLSGARLTLIGVFPVDSGAPQIVPFGDSPLDARLPDFYLVHCPVGNMVAYATLEVDCRVESRSVFADGKVWTVDSALERDPYRVAAIR